LPWPAPSASIDRDRTALDPAQLAARAPGGGALLLLLKAFSDQVELLTAETGRPAALAARSAARLTTRGAGSRAMRSLDALS